MDARLPIPAVALIDTDVDDRNCLGLPLLQPNMSGTDACEAVFAWLPPEHDIPLSRQIVATDDLNPSNPTARG